MSRCVLAAIVAAAMCLTGCAKLDTAITGVNSANNALARLADGKLPTACAIIKVAEGYFHVISARVKLSASTVAAEQKAEAIVSSVCANPPRDVLSAFETLMDAWSIIQAKTTIPGT